jgi:hypothetical protein
MFEEVLDEIESLVESHSDVDVVIVGGDFNTDVTRSASLHVVPLEQFCIRNSLCMCVNNPISQVDFTYTNEVIGAKSTLDHFIVSLNVYHGYSCMHDGDNLSDHHPVQLELNIEIQYSENCEARPNAKPSWCRAKHEHLLSYKQQLRTELSRVTPPLEALTCNQFDCNDVAHMEALKAYYASIEHAVMSSADACIPKCKKKAMAGWFEHVGHRKETAMFWYSMWVNGGSVRSGWLHAIMLHTCAIQASLALGGAQPRETGS